MKSENKAEVIARWARGEEPGPYIVDLSPTDYCNIKCRSCWARNPAFEGKLDSKYYEVEAGRLFELIDEGAELGVAEWEITGGGEPLVRKKVTPKLIEKIMALGMTGNMTTNGTLFTADLAERMVAGGWSKVVFSLDGHDDETNDYLRGRKGSFSRSTGGLSLFKESKARLGRENPLIAFNTVLSNRNVDHLTAMIELAARYEVGMVNFEPITIHSPLGDALALGPDELDRLPGQAERAARAAEALGVVTNVVHYTRGDLAANANTMDQVIRQEGDPRDADGHGGITDPRAREFLDLLCYEPWYHLVIKVDGQAGPCCIYDERGVSVKDHSLAEIWHGDHFRSIREAIRRRTLPRYCGICNAGQVVTNRHLREEIAAYLEGG